MTTPIIDRFPGIKRVALDIAYCNGMINQTQTEEEWLISLDPIIGADGVDEVDLQILDQWCQSLSDEDVSILSDGEEMDQVSIANKCPKPELCGLFNDIFDGEC